jgi:hypothetical protein
MLPYRYRSGRSGNEANEELTPARKFAARGIFRNGLNGKESLGKIPRDPRTNSSLSAGA